MIFANRFASLNKMKKDIVKSNAKNEEDEEEKHSTFDKIIEVLVYPVELIL